MGVLWTYFERERDRARSQSVWWQAEINNAIRAGKTSYRADVFIAWPLNRRRPNRSLFEKLFPSLCFVTSVSPEEVLSLRQTYIDELQKCLGNMYKVLNESGPRNAITVSWAHLSPEEIKSLKREKEADYSYISPDGYGAT